MSVPAFPVDFFRDLPPSCTDELVVVERDTIVGSSAPPAFPFRGTSGKAVADDGGALLWSTSSSFLVGIWEDAVVGDDNQRINPFCSEFSRLSIERRSPSSNSTMCSSFSRDEALSLLASSEEEDLKLTMYLVTVRPRKERSCCVVVVVSKLELHLYSSTDDFFPIVFHT